MILERWTQALILLFEACEPLTFDCPLSKEEIEARNTDIKKHTFYCLHVKGAIKDGVEPLSWDEWSTKERSFTVETTAYSYKITKEEISNIVDDINSMFNTSLQKD
jgi:hypothetical protein